MGADCSDGIDLGVGDGVGFGVGGCDEDGVANCGDDAVVDATSLFGGGGEGVSDDAGPARRGCGQLTADVALERVGREIEVACPFHVYEVRVEE